MNELAQQIIEELGVALKEFGSYSFDDKGPNEVMDISALVAELRVLTPTDAAMTLIEVATCKKHKGRGLQVAMSLVTDLQDWDELFETPGIDDILNGDLPGSAAPTTTPIPIKAIRADQLFKELLNK